jgi:Tol biopolymer transport system component/DNA-binding winged helix-turn-helix (wHTH) protein
MNDRPVTAACLRFGLFEADPTDSKLFLRGNAVRIENQPLQILILLLQRPGALVTREELQKLLWPADTFVEFDDGLNTAVKKLRYALGDSAENPIFIETVPRRGYRFIAPVSGNGATVPLRAPEVTQDNLQQNLGGHRQVRPSPIRTRWISRLGVAAILAVLIAAIVSASYRWFPRLRRPSFDELQFTRLTNNGRVEDVAISPDGRYVAYLYGNARGWSQIEDWMGGKSSLRLRQVATNSEVQILVDDADLYPGLTFSPDGDYIFFLRNVANDQMLRELYVIPVLGGRERKLVHDIDSAVSFSPDGRQFVYTVSNQRERSIAVRVANVDGSGNRLLASLNTGIFAAGAAWSPDGQNVAVSWYPFSGKATFALDVISVANGTIERLMTHEQLIGRPRWFAGGSMLLVTLQDQDRRGQLWAISYPRGGKRRLTNDSANYDLNVDTTRDARMLVAADLALSSNLWIAEASNLAEARQVTFSDQPLLSVVPLSTGKILTQRGGGLELSVMNSDGSQLVGVGGVRDATFPSACGRYFLFSSGSDITRVDADGTNPRRLANGYSPTCSLDRRFVFYAEPMQPRWKIRRVAIDGGMPVDVIDNPGESIPGYVTVSSDGEFLAFPFDTYAPAPLMKIGIVRTGGGPLVKTLVVPGTIDAGPRWSPDGKSLQYLLDRDQAANLWEQPLAGGSPRQVTKFTSGKILDFHWSINGKQLLLCRGETAADVVLVNSSR